MNIFKNIIDFCDAKLSFQQPLLQSSVSHDPSEIILIWYNSWCLIFNVENNCAAPSFCKNHGAFFRIFYLIILNQSINQSKKLKKHGHDTWAHEMNGKTTDLNKNFNPGIRQHTIIGILDNAIFFLNYCSLFFASLQNAKCIYITCRAKST